MKKNIRVNVSGILFNIDEDAYKVLEDYLKRLEQHFKYSQGSKEIIDDIESGIAEMMSAKINESKTIISISDLDEIMKAMGEPGEIDVQDEHEENETYENGRPKNSKQRRLYRNGDAKVIGGVCSGISSYLNIDVVWVRILFLLLLLISGTGFIIYIILWMAVPEATTTSQKLEMEGEPINIDNIEKKIRDEINNLGDQLNDLKRKHFSKKKDIERPIKNVLNAISPIFYAIGRAFLIFFGAIFSILAFLLIIFLIPAFFFANNLLFNNFNGFVYFSIPEFANAIGYNSTDYNILVFAVGAVLFIPLLLIVLSGLAHLFNIREIIKGIKKALVIIWILSLIMLTYSAIKIADNFRQRASATAETKLLVDSNSDTLYVEVNPDLMNYPIFDEEVSDVYDALDEKFLLYKENNLFFSVPEIETVKTSDSLMSVEFIKKSSANKKQIAETYIQNFNYKFNLKDSLLEISPLFTFPIKDKWRAQNLKLKIYIPEGKFVKFVKNKSIKQELFRQIENAFIYNH